MLSLFEALTYHLLGGTIREFLNHAMGDREDHPSIIVGAGPRCTSFRVEPHHDVVSVQIDTPDVYLNSFIRQTEVPR